MDEPGTSLSRGWRAVLVVAVLASIVALAQAHHRASKGENALVKWAPAFEALERGEPIYGVARPGVGAEGYPTLPLSLLVMRPFHALGPTAGPLAWAAAKVVLAWLIVWAALALAAGRARAFPAGLAAIVVVLSFRPLYSDVQHGNVNVPVGATVVAAAWAWSRRRELECGTWIALGAVLKVTPLLAALLFLRQRSARGLAGLALGLALYAFVLPSLWLGPERNVELVGAWWRQMVEPYVEQREPELMQTEHINQSLFGVLARLTTDAVAIEADPPEQPTDVRVTLVSLSPRAFHVVHRVACLAVLAVLWIALGPRRAERDGRRVLGELALLALAMLMLSERSWKHHYVLLALPIAYLAIHTRSDETRRVAWLGIAASAVLFGLTGEAVLGHRGSNLAEAWGAFLAGALVLFASCAVVLARTRGAETAGARSLGPALPRSSP